MASYLADVDILQATSSVSLPFYLLSLEKNESISAEFQYNYYTRDEGVSEITSLSGLDAESDQYDFIIENWERGVAPRQVNLRFSAGSGYPKLSPADGVQLIKDSYDNGKIVFEDAPFSTKFSSVIVNDTSVDETIYQTNLAMGSESDSEIERNFLYIARLQSAGYGFSKSQVEEEVVLQYEKDIKGVNLGASLNDLVVSDMLKTTTRWQASAYVDEFASVIDQAQTVQDESRSIVSSDPYSITEDEVDVYSLSPIETTSFRLRDLITTEGETFSLSDLGFSDITSVAGYIIEKYGEQLDGTTLQYNPIFIEDPAISSNNDREIRYGGVYKYKIRTVYKTYVTSFRSDYIDGSPVLDVAAILVASTGVATTVQCVESVPPLPPKDISFQQTQAGLYIRWNFPINTTKDIKRFQVFRRNNVEEPFRLISEINFDQSVYPYTSGESVPSSLVISSTGPIKHYLDRDFNNLKSDYIYSLCSIDAHGLSSAFSEQFRVRFDNLTGKIQITRISTEGAPKPYPNVNILADLFSDLIKDSGHSRIRIYFDAEYADVTREGSSLSLISTTDVGSPTYKLCLTELNLGKNQNIDIVVGSSTVTETGIPLSTARFYTAD
jgi:hypothetical protein